MTRRLCLNTQKNHQYSWICRFFYLYLHNLTMNIMEYICLNCGCTFTSKTKKKYCSVKCRSAFLYKKSISQDTKTDSNTEVVCRECGRVSFIPNHRAKRFVCCSLKCMGAYNGRIKSQKVRNICPICGIEFFLKPFRQNKNKVHCCSVKCLAKLKSKTFSGAGNHQYGVRGDLNASFKRCSLRKKNNNLTEKTIYVKGYNRGGYIDRALEHRYIVESNYHLFDVNLFENVEGFMYLKKGIDVHHIDLNHDNNDISNLIPITRGEHRSIHNKLRKQKRCKDGKFSK